MTRSLGIIGIGAFGAFMLKHVTPYFDVVIHDPFQDLSSLEQRYRVRAVGLEEVAARDIVVVAVPVQKLAQVVQQIAPYLRPDALLMDVCSVKVKPTAALLKYAPPGMDIVSIHPLFGPNSGAKGIHGLVVSVMNIRGKRMAETALFLRRELGLKAVVTTPERHDREMAYVQGLTHLIGRSIVGLKLPERMRQTTPTFDHLMNMVNVIKDDSDDLFRAIEAENPFARDVKDGFLERLQAMVSSTKSED
jgi:prephenate dehydrogenase